MRFASLSVFLPALISAQTITFPTSGSPASSTAPVAETKAEDMCSLEGGVVNAVTGEPLKKVTLNLTRTDVPPGMAFSQTYSTSSDAGGKFTIKPIEPGKYRLAANRNGFVSMAYGARALMRPGHTPT